MIDLRPALAAVEPEWRRLERAVYERMHFILGPQVRAFEGQFAQAMGAPHAVGVGSGTAAIEICLRAAGVAGEVLTSAMTAPFTGVAILAAGATPRFADIDPETLLLDPDDAANRMTRRTGALLPVHLYGQPCRIDRFRALARDAGIPLVQDACQAHGARYQGQPLTRFSPYVAYSFYPTKNLGCLGDGGAVTTGSARVAGLVRSLRDGGRDPNAKGLRVQISHRAATNARLDELQACLLSALLPHLDAWNAARAQIARLYDEALAGCPGVGLVRRHACSVCHLYVIRAARRERLRTYLAERGIATGVHYPAPLHLHPAFAGNGLRRGDLPHAERAAREIVSLPLYPFLAADDAARVAAAIRAFYTK